MLWAAWKANKLPPRVRSKGIRPVRDIRVGLQSGVGTFRGVDQIRRARRIAVAVQADRIEGRVGNAETEVLQEAGLLHVDADLEIVRACRDGKIALHAPVQELARLALRGGRVGEGIAAGVVIELVLADVRIDGQQRVALKVCW